MSEAFLVPPPNAQPTTSFDTRTSTNASDFSKNKNVLLVDDSILILKMLKRSLLAASHDVVTAVNGAEAVAEFEKHQAFDVILLDMQMPVPASQLFPPADFFCTIGLTDPRLQVMDGLEAARRIREFERNRSSVDPGRPRTFIIGISANSDEETVKLALDSGVDYFLPKPFQPSAMLALLTS